MGLVLRIATAPTGLALGRGVGGGWLALASAVAARAADTGLKPVGMQDITVYERQSS